MADHRPIYDRPAQYEETTDPRNPPNSVVRPAARRKAVRTYVGGIAALFLIVAALLLYWTARDDGAGAEQPEASAVGTGGGGEPLRDGDSPGGFDPQERPDSTSEELERRGAGERPQGPMPGLTSGQPVDELESLFEDEPNTVVGRRVDVSDVTVDGARDGNTFWIKDGDARAAVIAPPDAPAVESGQRVHVSGTVEPDGNGSVRIRATRIETR